MSEFFKNDGLAVTAYDGDGAVLLAFDIDKEKTQNLAGFAVKAITPNKILTNERVLVEEQA